MTLFGRPFRPRLWTSLAALIAFLLLIGLGSWQVVRLQWKEGLIAERQARWEAPAIDLPEDPSDPALLHRRVRVSGHYLHDAELHLPGRSYKGSNGLGVATPFVLDDGRGLIVYRGWVPSAREEAASRPGSNPEGEVTIEGVLLSGGWKGSSWAEPANDPARNAWFFVDPAGMAAAAGLERPIEGVYLGLYRDDPESALPFTPPPPMELRNDHLQYAITWYALAFALLVIYVIYHLGPKAKEEEEPQR